MLRISHLCEVSTHRPFGLSLRAKPKEPVLGRIRPRGEGSQHRLFTALMEWRTVRPSYPYLELFVSSVVGNRFSFDFALCL